MSGEKIHQNRLNSLDAFRGFTMAAMVIVNNPGSWSHVFGPLRHAEWIGCTPTDLVFPFFLFIVGCSIELALTRSGSRVEWNKALRRSAILFGVGLLLAMIPWPGLDHLRIPGVLQRIAICFVAALALVSACSLRTQVGIACALLIGYGWLLLNPPGDAAAFDPEANWVRTIDHALIGQTHLYAKAETDPEGLLSTLPALVTVLAGVWTMRALNHGVSTRRLVGAGVAVVLLSLGMGFVMPVSKPLWTPTYVVYTAGLSMLFLSAWKSIADQWNIETLWRPFALLGRNAIVLYVGSGLLARALVSIKLSSGSSLKEAAFAAISSLIPMPELASMTYALLMLGVWAGVLVVMHRRRIYVSL